VALRPIPALWVIVVAIVLLVAGVVIGSELGPLTGGTSPTSSSTPSSTLSICAAGTLGTPFGSIASLTANTTNGVSAPTASQKYEGSLSVMAEINQLGNTYDIVGSADYHLIPQQLETQYASWEVVFGTSPEALVYDPTVSALAGMNATNWPSIVLASGLPMGIANASTDPNGYNEIFVLELQGLHDNGSLAALYGHFFSTPVGSYAIANPSTTKVEPESNVASLITTHAIPLFITYRSYAVSHSLSYVDFLPDVGLGNTDTADLAAYAQASTTIEPTSGTVVVHGAPVLFSVTVPLNAPNPALGTTFIDVLLSPAGAAILMADGLTPVVPAWSDRPTAVPAPLSVDVVALPAALQGQLPA
jgi:tungstate ABC transporter binding protein WtpA